LLKSICGVAVISALQYVTVIAKPRQIHVHIHTNTHRYTHTYTQSATSIQKLCSWQID